eukprot:gene1904-3685_t
MAFNFENLTANLLKELQQTNSEFDKWADSRVKWLGNNDATYERKMNECESTITALRSTEVDLESMRDQNNTQKTKQTVEIQKIQQQYESLLNQKNALSAQLMSIEVEQQKEAQILSSVKEEHASRRAKVTHAVNEFTHGIRYYMALGLDFQRAENECMKFTFTQIDPDSSSKPFYFLLYVDANDRYQLVETCPKMDSILSEKHLNILNDDNNISRFVNDHVQDILTMITCHFYFLTQRGSALRFRLLRELHLLYATLTTITWANPNGLKMVLSVVVSLPPEFARPRLVIPSLISRSTSPTHWTTKITFSWALAMGGDPQMSHARIITRDQITNLVYISKRHNIYAGNNNDLNVKGFCICQTQEF